MSINQLRRLFAGTNENAIIQVLANRTVSQRQEIAKIYKASYGIVSGIFLILPNLFQNIAFFTNTVKFPGSHETSETGTLRQIS